MAHRLRLLALVFLTACGDVFVVEVGEERIAPLLVHVELAPEEVARGFAHVDYVFLTEEDSRVILDQARGKLGALRDVKVSRSVLEVASRGSWSEREAPRLGVTVALGGVTLGTTPAPLGPATTAALVAQVRVAGPVKLPVDVTIARPPAKAGRMVIDCRVQPILVIDGLSAL